MYALLQLEAFTDLLFGLVRFSRIMRRQNRLKTVGKFGCGKIKPILKNMYANVLYSFIFCGNFIKF